MKKSPPPKTVAGQSNHEATKKQPKATKKSAKKNNHRGRAPRSHEWLRKTNEELTHAAELDAPRTNSVFGAPAPGPECSFGTG